MVIWNANTTHKKHIIDLRSSWVMACAYERSHGNLVASGGLDNICTVYKLPTNPESRADADPLMGHEGYLSSCRFIDESQILSASGDSTCILWDVEKSVMKQKFLDHTADVMSIALSPTDTNLFVSASVDMTCRLWDIRSNASVMTYDGHESDINSVDFFPSGVAFGTGSDDSTCKVFDLRSYQELKSFRSDKILSGITSVGFSSSGRLLFASYDDYKVISWDMLQTPEKALTQSLELALNRVSCMGIREDGGALAAGSWDMMVRVCA